MSLFKSVFNGIGSGAGVAWPFFGIVFTVVGGSVGGLASLTLGVVSIGIFFAVSLPVVYFSYQQMHHDEQQCQRQLQKNEHKLLADIDEYIGSIHQYALCRKEIIDVNKYFSDVLAQDLKKIGTSANNLPLYQCLAIINEEYQQHQRMPADNKIIVQRIAEKMTQQPMPYTKILLPAFQGFVGTFGSLAGCSAGVSGLLTGMGVFSSFAAFPLLGWGVIGVALIGGVYSAYSAIIDARAAFTQQLLSQMFKKMHCQLNKAIIEHNLNTVLEHAPDFLAKTAAEKKLCTQRVQPEFALPSSKNVDQDKFSIGFSSFFKTQHVDGGEQAVDLSSGYNPARVGLA